MADSESDYQVGKILKGTWGYDQTNVDFYRIARRTNDTLWLQPLHQTPEGDAGFMSEYISPGTPVAGAKLQRRKLVRDREGRPIGCRFSTYGWIAAWEGRRAFQSHYA